MKVKNPDRAIPNTAKAMPLALSVDPMYCQALAANDATQIARPMQLTARIAHAADAIVASVMASIL